MQVQEVNLHRIAGQTHAGEGNCASAGDCERKKKHFGRGRQRMLEFTESEGKDQSFDLGHESIVGHDRLSQSNWAFN